MFSTFKWKKGLWVALLVVSSMGLLAAVEQQRLMQRCQGVVVVIDDGQPQHSFVTAADVRRLLNTSAVGTVVGARLTRLDLNVLEARLRSNSLIKHCEVATDLSGMLTVKIRQQRPIARLIERRGLGNDTDGYLNEVGEFLPLSDHYTARVLLVSGTYFDRVPNLTAPRHQALLALLKYIAADPFWNAQIAQMIVERDGEVQLLPQVGDQRIEFGAPTEPEAKFRKLNVFYKFIAPAKGWNTYRQVSVKYRNQIVCVPTETPEANTHLTSIETP